MNTLALNKKCNPNILYATWNKIAPFVKILVICEQLKTFFLYQMDRTLPTQTYAYEHLASKIKTVTAKIVSV